MVDESDPPAMHRDDLPEPVGTLRVVVNGEPRLLPPGSTALDLLMRLGLGGRPVAVEHNEQVVPRARLADCTLQDGDRLELVTLVGGG